MGCSLDYSSVGTAPSAGMLLVAFRTCLPLALRLHALGFQDHCSLFAIPKSNCTCLLLATLKLLATCYLLLATNDSLIHSATCYLLPATCYSLLAAPCSLLAAPCSLLTIIRVGPSTCHLLLSILTTYYLSPMKAAYYSLLSPHLVL